MARFGKIPISIHPLFWVFASLIGWLNSNSLIGTLVWLVIIIVSVLVHELGHALSAMFFDQKVRIDFVALGGLTSYQGKALKLWQQFLIVLNGPVFGFLLFLFATLILKLQVFSTPLLVNSFRILQIVNLFWSIVNLFPVIPLDGGQLLRIVFEGIWGIKGIRYAIFTGMILAASLSFFFFVLQHFIIGAIFFLFAYQSFDTWRKAKFLSGSDRDENLRQKILQGELALKSGEKDKAKDIFEEIREKSNEGMIFTAATQYLSFLLFEEGHAKQAYEILSPLKKQLSPEALCLLHKVSYFMKDYSMVVELSSECYQITSTQEVALTNARAFAGLKKGKPAGGWLQTAYQLHTLDLDKILSENIFKNVAEDKEFLSFVDKLKQKED